MQPLWPIASLEKRMEFQSSPGQKAGCNRPRAISASSVLSFQSSPGQKAGCNQLRPIRYGRTPTRFNPHPARRPGATRADEIIHVFKTVSILTRPEGRVQRLGSLIVTFLLQPVSILTRPEGRVQLNALIDSAPSDRFQSSPGQKAGCNPSQGYPSAVVSGFQSSPGQKAGCNGRDSLQCVNSNLELTRL